MEGVIISGGCIQDEYRVAVIVNDVHLPGLPCNGIWDVVMFIAFAYIVGERRKGVHEA